MEQKIVKLLFWKLNIFLVKTKQNPTAFFSWKSLTVFQIWREKNSNDYVDFKDQ